MNYLIVLVGPGGSGKDTILNELLKDSRLNLTKAVGHTSRHPREGERNGIDYYFVTREQFERLIKHDQMIEHEVMATNHHYYGTEKKSLLTALGSSNVICQKMANGTLKLKEYFKDQAIIIFIDTNDDELQRRLLHSNRAIEHSQIARRLKQAQGERLLKPQFDLVVTNHDGALPQVVEEITQFILQKMSTQKPQEI